MRGWIFLFSMALAACSTAPNRAPIQEQRAVPPASRSLQVGKDWRPQSYTVKKGDTLYGIALEFGLDYKELAEWNGITNINRITAGRELKLAPSQEQAVTRPLDLASPAGPASPLQPSLPIQSAPPPAAQPIAGAPSALKDQPQAQELPYSEEAMKQLGMAPEKAP